eukprot:c1262_g1_i1.p1 GENE.c1262_g1_i1~~c1262_g1_i1.p1  ORF type:complete len:547 (+),score=113.14 c1262_g1_i1:237-1877(+)
MYHISRSLFFAAPPIPNKLRLFLFTSHFAAMWSQRMWQFSIILFLTYIRPDTLFYVSAFGFVSNIVLLMMSSWVGRWVDAQERLFALRVVLLLQEFLLAVSALVSWFLLSDPLEEDTAVFILLILLLFITSSLASLASTGSTIVIEKDWVVVIARKNSHWLTSTNSQLRQIDLICALAAPALAGAIMSAESVAFTALAIVVWNIVAVLIEYIAMKRIYDEVPELAVRTAPIVAVDPESSVHVLTESSPPTSATTPLSKSKSRVTAIENIPSQEATSAAQGLPLHRNPIIAKFQKIPFISSVRLYLSQPIAPAAIALAILYLTVLNFGGVMITYASNRGMAPFAIGLVRAVASLFGLFGSFVFPRMAKRFGLVRAGQIGLISQLITLLIALVSVWIIDDTTSLVLLNVGVVLSRSGLWQFDLAANQLLQEAVAESQRGTVNGVQASAQAFFELLSFLIVMAFNRPSQFSISAVISFGSVFIATILFSRFASQPFVISRITTITSPNQRIAVVQPKVEEEFEEVELEKEHSEHLAVIADADMEDVKMT